MEAEDAAVEMGPRNRTPHDALEESRAAMEDLAAKMLFIKKEGCPKPELRDLVTQMSLFFITLRQVNRSILLEEDRVKAETEGAKAPVDFATLQLHNLMYEKNHYLKAIKACRDFRSKYPDIELVPEEEFLRDAPGDIRGGVLSTDGAHDLMLKRLNYELHQRKELCKLHEKLEQHKKHLLETIANRKKFLSSLPSHLKALKKASLPVQQQLGILQTKKSKQNRAAELLPPPLYIIFSQLLSQKEAFGENIELEVLGSIKEAQAFAQEQANKDNGLAEESVPTSSSSSATEARSTESSSTAMDSHFSVSVTSSHTSDGSTVPSLESAIVVSPLSIIFPSPQPLMIQASEQITEEATTATHDAVLDIPPLDIVWPSFQPAIYREVDIMSSMMFEQLREILERRPLFSLEMARTDMLARTSAYHILGYPRDPWMVSLQAVWVGLVRLHFEEQHRHWESQVLPQLKKFHVEVDTVKREAAFVSSTMSQAQSRMMEVDKSLRAHILNAVQLRQELHNCLELIISYAAVSTMEVNRMQELQHRDIVISERLAAIDAHITKLEQMRPGRS